MRNLSIVLVGLLCSSVNNNEQPLEQIDTIPIKEIKIEKVENEIKPIVRNLDDLV